MAVGDAFKVALNARLNEQLIVNVFHYRQATANTSAKTNLESLARAFLASVLNSGIAGAAAENMNWFLIEARTFTTPATPLSGYDLDIDVDGTNEDTPAPPTVCWVVRKRTALLGRKYRGRNYYAGMPQGDILEGKIDPAAIAKYQTARDAIGATITYSDAGSPAFVPCIAAIDRDPGPPIVYTLRQNDVISVDLDTVLRSQRRREIGVGA